MIKLCTICNKEFKARSCVTKTCSKACCYENAKLLSKKLYIDNSEYKKQYQRQYYKENQEKERFKKKEKYNNNIEYKEHKLKYEKKYKNNNKELINKRNKIWATERKKNDVNYRLSVNLRGRLNKALVNNFKSGSTVRDLGCSIEELKRHLESQFKSGMSWDNWARKGWHIDHIKPLSSFNLSNKEQFLEACHYGNLQPLWWYNNIKKSNKIIED